MKNLMKRIGGQLAVLETVDAYYSPCKVFTSPFHATLDVVYVNKDGDRKTDKVPKKHVVSYRPLSTVK